MVKTEDRSPDYKAGYKAGYTKGKRELMKVRTANWIMKKDGWYCSDCGTKHDQAHDDFCCKCGAKMSEEAL